MEVSTGTASEKGMLACKLDVIDASYVALQYFLGYDTVTIILT